MEPSAEAPVHEPQDDYESEESRENERNEKQPRWKKLQQRNPKLRTALIIGAVVVLVGGFFLWRHLSSYEATDDAQIDGHLASISARVSGHVAKILVQDNQYVEAGTPLVEIDPKDYQIALDRAKADYAEAVASSEAAQANVPIISVSSGSQVSTAQADVENARAGISVARKQMDAAQAQVLQAEAADLKAQSDLARYQQLVGKEEISRQQFDQAVSAARASAAAVDAAKATASAAEQQVKQAQSKLLQAESSLRSAATGPQQVAATRSRARSAAASAEMKAAALRQAELNLGYVTVVAPVSGVVSNRTVEVGQNIQTGQEMMKVVSLEDIWVTADFKETQLRDMRQGQRVTISVDAFDRTFKGHVQSVAGASGARFSLLPPENATGNYVKVVQRIPVKITFDPGETKEHILRPGMSVEPKVWIR